MCAGPYGHLLLQIDEEHSKEIRHRLDEGHIGEKPGWVRISFSPCETLGLPARTVAFQVLLEGVEYLRLHGKEHVDDYELRDETGEWVRKAGARVSRT